MDFVVLHCSAQNTPLTIIDLGLHIDVDLLFEWINDGVLCDQIRYCRISRADTSVIPSLISLPVDALRLLVKNVGSTAWGENWFANLRESYGKVLECDINAAGLTGYREWLQDERLGRHTIKIAELRNRIIEDSLKAPKIFTALREEQYFIIPVLLRKLTKGFGVMRLGFRSRISYRGFF